MDSCFSPNLLEVNKTIWAFSGLLLLCASLFLAIKLNQFSIVAKYRLMLLLFLAFLLVISAGLIGFSVWTKSKICEICFFKDHWIYCNNSYSYDNIEKLYMFADRQNEGMVQVGSPKTFLLLIIETGGKQIVLSEHHYDIDLIKDNFEEIRN